MPSKTDMITAIKYFFAKKKRRMTNLTKATINKLKEIIDQYDIYVEGELEEMKVIDEQDRIKYEQEKEERRIRDEAYAKERKIKEEKEERTVNDNERIWKKYLPQVKELVEIKEKANIKKDLDFGEAMIKKTGVKYERFHDHIISGGIPIYISRVGENYYYNWLLKPKFIIVDKKFVPIL